MIKCKGSQTKNVQLVDYVYNACKNDEKKNPMQQLTYDASMMLFCHVLITKKENNIRMKNRCVNGMGLGIFPPIRHGMVTFRRYITPYSLVFESSLE
jgi:hypothetical protein